MSWSDRNCIQKVVLILSIFAVIAALACLAANLTTTVKAAQQKWFRPCDKCAEVDDPEECQKYCCSPDAAQCGLKGEILFYVMRGYSILLCIFCICGEVPSFDLLLSVVGFLKYFWGRGLLQAFVGFLTVTGNVAPDNDDAALAAEVLGWLLVGTGGIHVLMSLMCFRPFDPTTVPHNDPSNESPNEAGDKTKNLDSGSREVPVTDPEANPSNI